jgi:hypothetical protein
LVVLALLSYVQPDRPLVSAPRYAVSLFPLFWPLARTLKDRLVFATVVLVCLLGM